MTKITALSAADAEDMASLHAKCFETAWSSQAFKDLMALPGAIALGARQPNGLSAFILASCVANETEILTLATQSGQRRRGLACLLLQTWAASALAHGVRKGLLEVAADNVGAIALYEGFGFMADGRRRSYYRRADGTRADAVLYSLKLDTAAGLDRPPTA